MWLPGLGHVPGFGSDPVAFFKTQIKKIGSVFSFELFGRDCVFLYLNDADAVDNFIRLRNKSSALKRLMALLYQPLDLMLYMI